MKSQFDGRLTQSNAPSDIRLQDTNIDVPRSTKKLTGTRDETSDFQADRHALSKATENVDAVAKTPANGTEQVIPAQRRILIAKFILDDDVEESPLTDCLRNHGYSVDEIRHPLPPAGDFDTLLDNCEQLWIWSSDDRNRLPRQHLESICQRWEAGRLSLYLMGDNTPFTAEANAILARIMPAVAFKGNYKGQQSLAPFNARTGIGFVPTSRLFSRVDSLLEGNTISRIVGLENTTLTPACYCSEGHVLIASMRNEGRAGLILRKNGVRS